MARVCDDCGSVIPVGVPGGRCPACEFRNALIPGDDLEGQSIGAYKIIEEIGSGGFGVVYLASQSAPVRRRVALKVLKQDRLDENAITRFVAEQQALAMMDHPNIAKIFDAGETDTGAPYSVMELLDGEPLTTYCDRLCLSPDERITIFKDICRGVHHAHQKGVIHRDLKPSNVIVVSTDDRPVPKIIDFGVAKATGTPLTELSAEMPYGNVIGTPEYMPPEQARGDRDIDTRADVYALGVLLYELLTGTQPFSRKELHAEGVHAILEKIERETPPSPSQRLSSMDQDVAKVALNRHLAPGALRKQVRGDLDWIVMKALEKARQFRYDTASAFAADIESYLDKRPLPSKRSTAVYRLRKFVRRNRALSSTIATGTALACLGLFAAWTIHLKMERERAQLVYEGLYECRTSRLPTVLQDVAVYQDHLNEQLKSDAEVPSEIPQKQLRAQLALLSEDKSYFEPISEWLFRAPPAEFAVVNMLMSDHDRALRTKAWAVIDNQEASSHTRMRALAVVADDVPANNVWESEMQDRAASWLVSQGSEEVAAWLGQLRPLASQLLEPLRLLYERDGESDEGGAASIALAGFLMNDVPSLLDLARQAGPRQLGAITRSLQAGSVDFEPELIRQFSEPMADDLSAQRVQELAQEQARLGLVLCLIGRTSLVWPKLSNTTPPDLRSYLIHGMAECRVDWRKLRDRFESESAPSILSGLMIALGGYDAAELSPPDREKFREKLIEHYTNDPHPAVRSSAEWLLREWKLELDLARFDQALQKGHTIGNREWYLTGKGDFTMVVLPEPLAFQMGAARSETRKTWGDRWDEHPHDEFIERSIAIATKEPTVTQFATFARALQIGSKQNEARVTRGSVSLKEAMLYCWWFTRQEGIPDEEQCYTFDGDFFEGGDPATKDGYLLKTGYRLPTEAEWEYACRSGSKASRHYGSDDALLSSYAWHLGNARELKPPGLLRPNAFGLFDMLGNGSEWCQDRYQNRYKSPSTGEAWSVREIYGNPEESSETVWRGGSSFHKPEQLRSAARSYDNFFNRPNTSFRIVRTMPKQDQTTNQPQKD